MLPKTILIRHRKYAIKKLPLTKVKQLKIEGDCSYELKRIRVNTRNKDEAAHTLLHEVLHAVIHEYELNIRSEERVVKTLENALMQVIRDNPKFVDYLQGELDEDFST